MTGTQLGMEMTTILDRLLERVLDIADYFIYRKHISLSEGSLFLFTFVRAIWYIIYGVSGGVINYVFPDPVWIGIFSVLAGLHFGSFFLSGTHVRGVIVSIYAIIWLFLTILAVLSSTTSPAAPTFAVFALMSVFISVRLFRDKSNA